MNSLTRNKPLLGTYVDISITAPLSDSHILELSSAAYDEITRIHQLMSFHESGSELSSINMNAHVSPVNISSDMEEVIGHALLLSALTDGLYDITVADSLMQHRGLPQAYQEVEQGCWHDITLVDGHISFNKNIKLDLGGIAKGYAVDRAMDILMSQAVEYEQVIINAGGDLRLYDWQGQAVSIRHPSPKKFNHFIEMPMQSASLATSAPSYTNKNSQIIHPATGKPLTNKDSVSVFAPSCMIADSLTKILFLEPENTSYLNRFNAKAVRITPTGQMFPIATAA